MTSEIKLIFISSVGLVILFIILIVLFIYIFNRRQNELLLKNQLEEEQYKNELLSKEMENQQNLIRERERISEDIHDDIGGILSAIRLQSEFIKHKTTDRDIAPGLDMIADNTLVATTNFRELIWCLHSRNDSFVELMSYIESYARTLFEKSAIKLIIEKEVIIDDIEVNSFIRRQILLGVKEILNNALKHSLASEVKLKYSLKENTLEINLSDNGIGLPDEAKRKNGLLNIEKRIGSINGKLVVNSEQNLGTRYQIELNA